MLTRALLGCVALCALAFVSVAEEPKETKLRPVLIFSGSHSAIQREQFDVIADEAAWKSLWEKHRGDAKTLRFTERGQYIDIDFDAQYVVAVFTAEGDGCHLTPLKRGDEIVIGFCTLWYGIEGRTPGTKDTRTEHEKAKEDAISPYAFVVLPKPVRTVVIEQNVCRNYKQDPAVWKERKRFPAPKDTK